MFLFHLIDFSFQLYNVIVDSEVTGKKLLQKGQLQTRVTIIPLNKVSARSIDNNTVNYAQRLVSLLKLVDEE